MSPDPSKLYTTSQAADFLGCSRWTVGRYIRRGDLPARMLGQEWRITGADLEAFSPPDAHDGARWEGARGTTRKQSR